MKRIISLILISSVLALSGCTVIKTVKEGIRSGKESTTVTKTTAESSMVASVSETPAETTSEASSATTTEKAKHSFKYEYGVFLSFEGKLEKLSDYYTIVIDAQYYDKAEIEAFKAKGHKVLSYINIGSLEDFRSYFKREYGGLREPVASV